MDLIHLGINLAGVLGLLGLVGHFAHSAGVKAALAQFKAQASSVGSTIVADVQKAEPTVMAELQHVGSELHSAVLSAEHAASRASAEMAAKGIRYLVDKSKQAAAHAAADEEERIKDALLADIQKLLATPSTPAP